MKTQKDYQREVRQSKQAAEQPRHPLPSDKIMLTIALADTLTREGYEDSTIDMVVHSVNAYETDQAIKKELLQMVKDLRRACEVIHNSGFNVFNTDVIDALIATAEGK